MPHADHTMSCLRVNAIAVPAGILFMAGAFLAFDHVWHPDIAALDGVFEAPLLVLAPVLLASVVVHELLHGVAFRLFGGVPWRRLRFGVCVRQLVAYAHAPVPVSTRVYRRSLLLPGVALGLLPAVAGFVVGHVATFLYGALMLAAAGGDLLILLAIRGLPDDGIVLDHPERCGCVLVDAP